MSELRVMIASPLEAEHVARIRREMPVGVELIYEPTLLPPTLYTGDHDGPDDFQRTPEDERRWWELIATADALYDFPARDRHPHTYAPQLKWVQTTSAGVGQRVARAGIQPGELIVTTASGVHARPLAEFVFLTLLVAVKQQDRLAGDQRAHHWERFCSDELTGKTLAIIGPGRIGREVARIARVFDMTPVALARDNRPERAAELGVDRLYAREELRDVLAIADAVVLAAPHTPETENLFDRAAFAALKRGTIFVNIGRGSLVDEDALLDALQDGTIRFAGLDVFRTEPLSTDSPFWELPNVLVSPHSASTTTFENERIVEIFLHNLRCFAEGRPAEMRNVLDIARMY